MRTSRPDQDKEDRDERARWRIVLEAMLSVIPEATPTEPGALTLVLLATRAFSAPEIAESLDEIMKRRNQ